MYLDTLFPQVEEWIRRSGRSGPFSMYVHVIDVHGPYDRIRLLPEDEAEVRAGIASGDIRLPRMDAIDMFSPTDRDNPYKSYLYDGYLRETDRYLGSCKRSWTSWSSRETRTSSSPLIMARDSASITTTGATAGVSTVTRSAFRS